MKLAGAVPTMGDCPGIWFGEFHAAAVTGDFPGGVSSLIACAVDSWLMFKPNGVLGLAVTNPLECDSCPEVGNCAVRLNCDRCFSRERSIPSLVNGFGRTSFMPVIVRTVECEGNAGLTVSEIHINIICAYVGSHGNDRDVWPNLSYADRCRDPIKVR